MLADEELEGVYAGPGLETILRSFRLRPQRRPEAGEAAAGGGTGRTSTRRSTRALPDSNRSEAEVLLAEGDARAALAAAEEVVALRVNVAGGLATFANGYVAALEAAFVLSDRGEGG